jgi:hypothetical protein
MAAFLLCVLDSQGVPKSARDHEARAGALGGKGRRAIGAAVAFDASDQYFWPVFEPVVVVEWAFALVFAPVVMAEPDFALIFAPVVIVELDFARLPGALSEWPGPADVFFW